MTTDTTVLTAAADQMTGVLGVPVEVRPDPEAAPATDDAVMVALAPNTTMGPGALWLPADGLAGLAADSSPDDVARSIALAVEQAFAAANGTTPRTVSEVVPDTDIPPRASGLEIVAGDVRLSVAWDPGEPQPASDDETGFGRLADVPLDVVVEIGRAKLPIRELLTLDEGSVVNLTRTVGEPVDLLVNGTPTARGDIVVVDGRLGIRVTEIFDR